MRYRPRVCVDTYINNAPAKRATRHALNLRLPVRSSRMLPSLLSQLCLWSPRGHGRVGLVGAVLLGRLYGCTPEDSLLRMQVRLLPTPALNEFSVLWDEL